MRYSGQIRAARASPGMAGPAGQGRQKIGLATLQRIEQTDGLVQANFSTVLKIRGALEKPIRFTDDDGYVGVRVSQKRW